MTTHPKYFPILEREIARMESILKDGLPACYSDFEDFLCDYGPDFSWTSEVTIIQLDELLASARWLELAEQIKTSSGFDFFKVITEWKAEELSENDN